VGDPAGDGWIPTDDGRPLPPGADISDPPAGTAEASDSSPSPWWLWAGLVSLLAAFALLYWLWRKDRGAEGSPDILADLQRERLDIGFVFGPVSDSSLTAHGLGSLKIVVAIPSAWAAELQCADWTALAKFPWVFSDKYCPFQVIADTAFSSRGLACQRVTATNDEAAKQDLVAAGVGLAIVLEAEAAAAHQRGDLAIWEGEPMSCPLSLVYASLRADDGLLRPVRNAVLSAWHASA
jgi:DNA-binding transcriptional LysR family regulator